MFRTEEKRRANADPVQDVADVLDTPINTGRMCENAEARAA